MIFAIDPGNIESAYVIYDEIENKIIRHEKLDNETLSIVLLGMAVDAVVDGKFHNLYFAIEKVASYGMPVGETTFETVFWSGRFYQIMENMTTNTIYRPTRSEIKMELVGQTAKVTDAVIIQRLRDLYAKNTSNYGKGTKKAPGFFYGFKKDVWQAFAVAHWVKKRLEE